jgi:hypothetical protein
MTVCQWNDVYIALLESEASLIMIYLEARIIFCWLLLWRGVGNVNQPIRWQRDVVGNVHVMICARDAVRVWSKLCGGRSVVYGVFVRMEKAQ